MVNNILNFNISENVGINIYLPTVVKSISRFEDVRTTYFNGIIEEVVLSKENLNETLLVLKNTLQKALNGELQLHSSIDNFKVGYQWNRMTNSLPNTSHENENNYFENYWLWSTNDIQTWIYNVEDTIFIEISPSYEWHFIEPTESDNYIPFDDFMKTYNEIAILKLEYKITREWYEKTKEILNTIIKIIK